MQRAAKQNKTQKKQRKAVVAPKRALKTTKKVISKTAMSSISSPITLSARNNSNVTAAMVKKLRDATGAPMIECKKALGAMFETPDFDANDNATLMKGASEWLRKRGAALANKNAGRSAKEGVVAMIINAERTKAALVELNCETDFVARNHTFMNYAARLALTVLNSEPKTQTKNINFDGIELALGEYMDNTLVDGPSAMPSNPNASTNSAATELIDVITNCRENIKPRRAGIVTIPAGHKGFVSGFMHNEIPTADESKPFFEKINSTGAILKLGNHAAIGSFALEGDVTDVADVDTQDLGRKVMMQTVASGSLYLSRHNVPAELVAKEKEIMLANTPLEGKPQNIIDKLLEGKLNKFYSGICLLDQEYALTNDSKPPTVAQLLDRNPAKPKPVSVVKYLRGEILPGEEFAEETPQ
jgi:elongation factor Ts